MSVKKVTSFGPMKGILHLAAGQVVEYKKDTEIVHDFKKILDELDGEEVTITIKRHEVIDEDE